MIRLQCWKTHCSLHVLKLFDDVFIFEHPAITKRSLTPSLLHDELLTSEPQVIRALQQRAKSRQKRDLKPIVLNDVNWRDMWYLVSNYFNYPAGRRAAKIPSFSCTARFGRIARSLPTPQPPRPRDLLSNYYFRKRLSSLCDYSGGKLRFFAEQKCILLIGNSHLIYSLNTAGRI
ncbi:Hypothetical predicted protein, partial [Cloeon dipterum]